MKKDQTYQDFKTVDRLNHTLPTATKLPLILFSGGMDSTHLLQTKLRESDVYTIYVKGSQSGPKIEQELKARKKIIATLEKTSRFRVIEDVVVDLGPFFNTGYLDEGGWKFRQASLWLMGALQVIDVARHSELNVAYVAGDQILSDLHEVEKAWMALQAFSRTASVSISFPLRYVRKLDILRMIGEDVFQHVWVCELPEQPNKRSKKLVECGKCDACITRYALLKTWEKVEGGEYPKNRYSDETVVSNLIS